MHRLHTLKYAAFLHLRCLALCAKSAERTVQ